MKIETVNRWADVLLMKSKALLVLARTMQPKRIKANRESTGPLALLIVVACLVSVALSQLAHGAETTLAVLESFQPFYMDLDELPEHRHERLTRIDDALNAATSDREELAFLVMTAWKESRFARFVDLDLPRCREGRGGWCDSGRAYSVMQLQGVKRTIGRARAVQIALSRYRAAKRKCRSIEGAIAGYAKGHGCKWAEAKERADLMRRIERRL